MPDPRIRPAGREDCAAMCAIYNHYVEHDTCTYRTDLEPLDERQAWFDKHGGNHPVFVAEQEAQVVGWASLSPYNPRQGYRMTVEDSVVPLDRDWRGRGLGTALLRKLIDAARAGGHHAIIAAISAEQDQSVALHRKLGFVEAGSPHRGGAQVRPPGRGLPAAHALTTLTRAPAPAPGARRSPRAPGPSPPAHLPPSARPQRSPRAGCPARARRTWSAPWRPPRP